MVRRQTPRSRQRWLVVVALALALIGSSCSSSGSSAGDRSDDPAGETTTTRVPLGNPGTLVAPTTTSPPVEYSLSVETAVAMLNACAPTSELVGACHCALGRIDGSLADADIVVFEDRFGGRNEFSPELAAALVSCEGAEAPGEWSGASRNTYVVACMKDAERLRDLCECSLERAEEIVPEARVREFAESDEVSPSFVDLINDCL